MYCSVSDSRWIVFTLQSQIPMNAFDFAGGHILHHVQQEQDGEVSCDGVWHDSVHALWGTQHLSSNQRPSGGWLWANNSGDHRSLFKWSCTMCSILALNGHISTSKAHALQNITVRWHHLDLPTIMVQEPGFQHRNLASSKSLILLFTPQNIQDSDLDTMQRAMQIAGFHTKV